MKTRYCVLTDCFRSGNLLVPEILQKDVGIIHVISSPRAVEVYTRSDYQDKFELEFVHDNLVDTLAKLNGFPIVAVIGASETGVMVADQIGEALGVPNNGTALSEARRNKFQMMEALRRAGVPHPKSLLTSSLEEALTWIPRETGFPVILKPKDSACTDSVFLCRTAQDVEGAFHSIYGKRNRTTLLTNADVLVQTFLEGTEYVVDMVSHEGQHFPSSLWRYSRIQRNTSAFVYDTMTLLPVEGEIQAQLIAYAKQVLDALGIRYGATHTEMILTQAGPRLVETGARMCGAFAPALVQAVTGYGQAQMTADAALDAPKFLEKVAHAYEMRKLSNRVFLISHQEGEITEFPSLPSLQSLKSFHRIIGKFEPGTQVVKTVDLYTNPGIIDLIHDDPQVLEQDLRAIRQMESQGLFLLKQA